MQFNFQIQGDPKDLAALTRQLQELCGVLELTFNENESLRLVELHVEPDKVESGRLYFADGTDWDPGSGRGVYCYDSDGPTWRFLG